MPKTFKPQLRTKNHTAAPLRNSLGEFAMRCIIRLGSRTTVAEAFSRMPLGRPVIEVNTVEACHNSGDKILMKQCFFDASVKTADYNTLQNLSTGAAEWITFPAIIKHKNSCKGEGIYLIENNEQLQTQQAELIPNSNYIIEQYLPYTKEYRLHVTKDGCFYACRKMLKTDAEERWHRHDTNSVWIMEENPLFEKPKNWDDIVTECVKALNSVGLDVCSCDIKVQSEKNRRDGFVPEFIILECNSASSMGSITEVKYREELPKIINDKINNYGKA